ncbi:MAG TPA: substrate-binding domain-containing protein, partial [Bryobacteraceae bacterium]|nr:substrate-binding domain-containing protein [Bryobacteraceae bacterium]
ETVQPGQPVELCRVDRRLVASAPATIPWVFPPADAVLVDAPGAAETGHAGGKIAGEKIAGEKIKVRLLQAGDELANRLLIAGCDPGTSVLKRHVQRAGVELVLAHQNSQRSLALLKQGWVHIAGTHLRDEASGESNLPAIHHLFPRNAVAVISFAVWEEGIVVAAGNPKKIRGVEDLARAGVAIVNREPGAGSRQLLDGWLRRVGIETSRVSGYGDTAAGHLPAAWRVRSGTADACIATRAAARIFGLDFLPLVSERYDLAIRRQHLDLPAVQTLLDTLSRSAFRKELEGIGGYDTSAAGHRLL